MSTARDIQEFYNAAWYDTDQKPRHATVTITIAHPQLGTITLPQANIHPGHRIADIMVEAHKYLLEHSAPPEVPTHQDTVSDVVRMERIEMKSGVYFVEQRKNGTIVIQSSISEIISPKTILGKSIINRYNSLVSPDAQAVTPS